MTAAAILGIAGPELTADERGFLPVVQPWGFILFGRNIVDREQLSALTASLRHTVGRDVPILIDQEGGRVERMGPPHWPHYLPALDQMAVARDPLRAQWLRNRLIAHDLHAVGIDVNCAPLGDLVEQETHPILLNRLYGGVPKEVADAARVAAAAMLEGGVLPVLKHIPGYGRAHVDSHLEPARVTASAEALRARDFAPFRALRDIRIGMTAHAIYEAIDPDAPATLSAPVIGLIREEIGFDGLLMTDDIGMEALSGTLESRAAKAIAAGCDLVLHSNGNFEEMVRVTETVGQMSAEAERRGDAALAQRRPPEPIDAVQLRAELEALTGRG
ncbi:glycoside hydrolase family 3 N-terminal domain-containing protein [Pseudoroseicyclus sp. CXY001]|uniref:glycoside hydrolase family 3 N-terminal domain-containing protein n=1 Tax=Pseudoroseicyclus sp. CXY001 TaxID=3242492 RepID=UPI00358DAF6B